MQIDQLTIRTGHAFLIEAIEKWIAGWIFRDWKRVNYTPVMYTDDWKEYLSEAEGFDVVFEYVPARARDARQAAANLLARQGIKQCTGSESKLQSNLKF